MRKRLAEDLRRAFATAGSRKIQRRPLFVVSLEGHRSTGKTTHRIGRPFEPTSLEVAQLDDDPGFYLFYLDAAGEQLNDTYHDSLARAFAQAEFEFEVRPEEWRSTGSE
jgi:hypothetical protein